MKFFSITDSTLDVYLDPYYYLSSAIASFLLTNGFSCLKDCCDFGEQRFKWQVS